MWRRCGAQAFSWRKLGRGLPEEIGRAERDRCGWVVVDGFLGLFAEFGLMDFHEERGRVPFAMVRIRGDQR